MGLVARGLSRPWVVLLVLLLGAGAAPAQDQPRYDIALVTVGPGSLYWERFGHNAILVTDRVTGDRLSYNYGIFDFEQKNFFLNFLRGHMRYRLAAIGDAADIPYYIRSGRRVSIQTLDLSQDERQDLVAFLEWNRQPENAEYRYDYFRDNCSTRVRDALDAALGGALRDHFQASPAEVDFRHDVRRLTQPVPWLYLGTQLGLGQSVDRPISRWDRFFVPMELGEALGEVRRPDGRALVSEHRILSPGEISEPSQAPHWWPWFLLAGVLLAGLQRWAGDRRRAAAWWGLNGLAGLLMAGLWAFTDHASTAWNENLLLFCPLSLVVAGQLLRGRRLAARPLIFAVAASALLALLLKATPWGIQDNFEFIALVLPVQLAAVFPPRSPASRREIGAS